ncbi:MAG: malonyl-ACP O-methyltransferase BioC [Xanthomonadales bacterium]|nr:malonyl-ACP O-methyltransferase BioC [Xanthomonadales bacterium]
MTPPVDQQWMKASFERAAGSYAESAALQREVEARLLERLDLMSLVPDRVLDLGCGLGNSTNALAARYPDAEVIGVDLAFPMLATGQHRGWRVCADAATLPLADTSCDLLFSNLMLQWAPSLPTMLDSFRGVLRSQGLLLFSTFGPDTLMELRHAWSESDGEVHVNDFADMHQIGDILVEAGYVDPVMDVERITVTYPDVMTLMRDLKAIGAHNVDSRRRRTLTGKRRLRRMIEVYESEFRMDDGRLPATYEVIYGHALGPPPGQPRRREGVEEATFSIDHLRGSRRRR